MPGSEVAALGQSEMHFAFLLRGKPTLPKITRPCNGRRNTEAMPRYAKRNLRVFPTSGALQSAFHRTPHTKRLRTSVLPLLTARSTIFGSCFGREGPPIIIFADFLCSSRNHAPLMVLVEKVEHEVGNFAVL